MLSMRVMISAMIVFGIPFWLNQSNRAATRAFTESDSVALPPSFPKAASIGLVRSLSPLGRVSDNQAMLDRRRDDLLDCNDVCRIMLYNGSASTFVMMAASPGWPGDAAADVTALAYTIERGEACEYNKPGSAMLHNLRQDFWRGRSEAIVYRDPLSGKIEPRKIPRMPPSMQSTLAPSESAAERIKARMEAGECLRRRNATLSDASIVIRLVQTGDPRILNPPSPEFFNEPLTVRRFELVDQAVRPPRVLYRKTEVYSEPFTPILLPHLGVGVSGSSRLGLGPPVPTLQRSNTIVNEFIDEQELRSLLGDRLRIPEIADLRFKLR